MNNILIFRCCASQRYIEIFACVFCLEIKISAEILIEEIPRPGGLGRRHGSESGLRAAASASAFRFHN